MTLTSKQIALECAAPFANTHPKNAAPIQSAFTTWLDAAVSGGASIDEAQSALRAATAGDHYRSPAAVLRQADEFLTVLRNDVTVPNVVGETLAAATSAATGAGMTIVSSETGVGATALNDGKVKSQDPAAATVLDPDQGASLVLTVVVYKFAG